MAFAVILAKAFKNNWSQKLKLIQKLGIQFSKKFVKSAPVLPDLSIFVKLRSHLISSKAQEISHLIKY